MNSEYKLTNTGSEVQEAISAAKGSIPSRLNSLESGKVDKISGKGLSTNDYSDTDKNKVAIINISGDGKDFLANDGTYKKVGQTIEYSDILNKPVLNTTNTSSLSTNSSELISGIINLHKISKTGAYSDLIGLPTIPTISLNGNSTTGAVLYAPTTVGTSGQYLTSSGTGAPVWATFPTIPTINLNGAATTAATIYAPTTEISTTTNKRYLIGSSATTNVTTENTSANCYMQNGYLYSNGAMVSTSKVNGTAGYNGSVYAPTTVGTSGQYLTSSGTGAPVWATFPTIPTINLNGAATTAATIYAPTTGGTSGQYLISGDSGSPVWQNLPTIPMSFSNITAGSKTLKASSVNDTLAFTAGNNISITSDSTSKTISISAINVGYTNYNDMTNKPITNSVGTSSSPIVLSSLTAGLYNISGYYKNNSSETDAIAISGQMLLNKYGDSTNGYSLALTHKNAMIQSSTYANSAWTTTTSYLPKCTSFDTIEVVSEYPTTMLNNVLYMKVEAI